MFLYCLTLFFLNCFSLGTIVPHFFLWTTVPYLFLGDIFECLTLIWLCQTTFCLILKVMQKNIKIKIDCQKKIWIKMRKYVSWGQSKRKDCTKCSPILYIKYLNLGIFFIFKHII